MTAVISERRLVNLVAIVQFFFVIDFMMVAPLGPDYSAALNADNSDIGYIVASYTLAAALAGLLFARFLDRFDRRSVLLFFLVGLSVSTVACAFSADITDLFIYRFIAGFFGGPAAAIAMAMVIDVVPEQRRGKAIGKVMSAFSLSSIIGIPVGLALSHYGGWQMPFYVVGGLVFLSAVMVYFLIPSMTNHLSHMKMNDEMTNAEMTEKEQRSDFKTLFYRPEALVSYVMTATGMLAAFLIIPNIAAYMQFNLAYPRESYGLLYFMGGVVSFFVMLFTGKAVDRLNVKTMGFLATFLIIGVVYSGFVAEPVFLSAVVLFITYMAAMSMRNVLSISTSSMVPAQHERAAFMSLNQSVSHFAAGVGAIIGSYYLTVADSGNLIGMDMLGIVAITLSVFMPFCIVYLSRFIARRNMLLAPSSGD